MKIIANVMLLLALAALSGCARITFNPDTGKVAYTRLGDQQFEGLAIEKTDTGFALTLRGQTAKAEPLTEAVRIIGALVPAAP